MDSNLLTARGIIRRRARALITTGVAALAAGAVATPAGAAVSGNHVIAALPDSSGLELTYPPLTALDVTVLRAGVTLGVARVTTDDQGAAAINGGGADCWSTGTPDILPGDTVEVTGPGFDDTMTVAAVASDRPVLGPDPGTVLMHGSAAGRPPASQLEARIIGASADPFAANGRRVLRAGTGQPYTIDYDGPAGGGWTATFTGLSAADVSRALSAKDARGVVIPAPSELTIAQNPAVRGPQAPCSAPLTTNAVTASSPRAVNLAHAGEDLVLTGVAHDALAVAVTLDDEDPATPAISAVATLSTPAGAQSWTSTMPAGAVAGLRDGALVASARFTTGSGTITGTPLPVVKDLSAPDAPTATPGPSGGPFAGPQAVGLADTDPGAAIHWTRDGSPPTAASPVLAPGATIAVSASQTIRAIAIDAAGNGSPAAVFAYTITAPSAAPVPIGPAGPPLAPAPAIIGAIPLLLPSPPVVEVRGTRIRALPTVRTVGVRVLGDRALRVAVRTDGAARVVRLRIFRAQDGRAAGAPRAVFTIRHAGAGGLYAVTLRGDTMRRLAAGRYLMEARAGVTADRLGPVVRAPFRLP